METIRKSPRSEACKNTVPVAAVVCDGCEARLVAEVDDFVAGACSCPECGYQIRGSECVWLRVSCDWRSHPSWHDDSAWVRAQADHERRLAPNPLPAMGLDGHLAHVRERLRDVSLPTMEERLRYRQMSLEGTRAWCAGYIHALYRCGALTKGERDDWTTRIHEGRF